MKIKVLAQTDIGKECTDNEDACVVCPDLGRQSWICGQMPCYESLGKYGAVAVVADGMGGASSGEVASSIAIEVVKNAFAEERLCDCIRLGRMEEFLREVVKDADEAINRKIEEDPEKVGMGTTIVLLWLLGTKAYIVWCGDSRCYVFNPGSGLNSLTKDHSYVQELIDAGEITIEQSYKHPDNNVITRCLGGVDYLATPDVAVYDVCPGDMFLLCSDGLCGYCRDKLIEKTLYAQIPNLDRCCKGLIHEALDAGGFDNVTVLLLSVVDGDAMEVRIPIWRRLKNLFCK